MLLSADRNTWGFVLNPKCASTSIQEVLGPLALRVPLGRRHALYDPERGDLRKVIGCVVRNPWERMVSGYLYWRERPRAKKELTFEEFVHGRVPGSTMYCSSFMLDFSRTPQCVWAGQATHVVRMETLQEDFCRWCDAAGVSKSILPCTNTTQSEAWKHYYDVGLYSIVEDRFRPDINAFGYAF